MKIALHGLEQKESILKADIDAIVNNSQPVELTSNYIKLNEEYEAIQRNIDNIKESNSLAIANIQSEINNIEGLIEEYQKSLTKLETYKNCLKRIDELKATEKKLAAEYEELEHQLYLTEEFMRTKVRILDDKINSKFKLARFKMFNVLINGGIEECCETIYNGVPYSDLNKGAKIQIGLDIIRTLQDHYNFSCPVWIDNRESIIKIPEMDCQIISLIVNGDDKKLRIEIIEKQNKEDIL
jgi:vacuolar-type H+-ATPase subunit I/STV1